MAWSLVAIRGAINAAGSGNTIQIDSANITGDITAGNHLFVITGCASDTLTGVADSGGNTYQVDNTYGGDNRSVGIASSLITNTLLDSGTTITATFSSATIDRVIILAEFSGGATSSWLDQNTNAQGTSTTPNSGNITTTVSGDLLIGAFTGNAAAANYAPGTTGIYSFAEISEQAPGRITEGEYAIVGAAGTYSANGTITSAAWTQAVAAYKPAVVAGGNIKKLNSIADANNKKVNSIAKANQKKINGITGV